MARGNYGFGGGEPPGRYHQTVQSDEVFQVMEDGTVIPRRSTAQPHAQRDDPQTPLPYATRHSTQSQTAASHVRTSRRSRQWDNELSLEYTADGYVLVDGVEYAVEDFAAATGGYVTQEGTVVYDEQHTAGAQNHSERIRHHNVSESHIEDSGPMQESLLQYLGREAFHKLRVFWYSGEHRLPENRNGQPLGDGFVSRRTVFTTAAAILISYGGYKIFGPLLYPQKSSLQLVYPQAGVKPPGNNTANHSHVKTAHELYMERLNNPQSWYFAQADWGIYVGSNGNPINIADVGCELCCWSGLARLNEPDHHPLWTPATVAAHTPFGGSMEIIDPGPDVGLERIDIPFQKETVEETINYWVDQGVPVVVQMFPEHGQHWVTFFRRGHIQDPAFGSDIPFLGYAGGKSEPYDYSMITWLFRVKAK